jgi:hypothetical protein
MKTFTSIVLGLAVLMLPSAALAQRGRGAGAGAAQTPRAAAVVDLTGYWVAVVTEDWRYRMVTPAQGDYQGVPLTPAARKIADSWDPAKESASGDQCKSYGAPAILRVPGRLHITWQDDTTLKLETDAGQQTRLFHFGNWKSPGGPKTLQGDSVAEWEGGGRGVTDGSMKVTTTNLNGGFLRKNGVPYSENASVTEYYEVVTQPDGSPLLEVTISTTDPEYLRAPFVISSQFKKEPNEAKWKPSPCSATW